MNSVHLVLALWYTLCGYGIYNRGRHGRWPTALVVTFLWLPAVLIAAPFFAFRRH